MAIRSTLVRIGGGVRRRASRVLDRILDREVPAPPPPPPPAPVSPLAAPPAPPPSAPADHVGPALITREEVQRLFEDMVRPALQSDGGDITLVKVEDNDVYVELVGACQTCPSSLVTMQQGIERLLREEFPQFGRLVRVDG